MVVLENQQVLDFDASGEHLVRSDFIAENWPSDIRYAEGGLVSNFLMIVGGISTVRKKISFKLFTQWINFYH